MTTTAAGTRPEGRGDIGKGPQAAFESRRRTRGRSALRIELRHTGALFIAAVITLGSALLLLTEDFASTGGWSSTWSAVISRLDAAAILWAPLVATVAAWVGGREQRHRATELLASTSRPLWQRRVTSWGAVSLGATGGFTGATVVLTAAILPGVSYWGGRWAATLLIVLFATVLFAAAGFVAGVLVSGRLVAPAVGLGALVMAAAISTLPGGAVRNLWPVDHFRLNDGYQVPVAVLAASAVWLLALITGALVAATTTHRIRVAIPLILAAVVAIPLATTDSLNEVDPAAQEMVCTEVGAPSVCVQRVHAAMLDEVAVIARAEMASVSELVTWRSAREHVLWGRPPRTTLLLPLLDGAGRPFQRDMADPAAFREDILSGVLGNGCTHEAGSGGVELVTMRADAIAAALLLRTDAGLADVPGAAERHRRLARDPDRARVWMRDYLAAAPVCDMRALTRLAGK